MIRNLVISKEVFDKCQVELKEFINEVDVNNLQFTGEKNDLLVVSCLKILHNLLIIEPPAFNDEICIK